MRYSFISAAFLAFASSVFAQEATVGFDIITSPTEGQKVPAGKPFDIVWQPGTKPEYLNGTATIVLLQGKTPKDLQIGETIVAGVKNSLGKYTWSVPATASFETYGLRITLDDDKSTTQKEDTIFQYSFPFQITTSGAASGTTTIILGTGTNYTPPPTPSVTKSAANTTSFTTTSSASAFQTSSSNFTLTTSARTTSAASTTASRPASQTANAAASNVVSGGIALVGGVVLAFAL